MRSKTHTVRCAHCALCCARTRSASTSTTAVMHTSMLYAHAGSAQRAMLLLPCTCSCDVPNGNATDIDSSVMRLSAGDSACVLGGHRYLFHTGAGAVHVYIFLMPATTPVVPALKKNSYAVPHLCLQPTVWPTAQLPGYRTVPVPVPMPTGTVDSRT
jgi:hypothetical protein